MTSLSCLIPPPLSEDDFDAFLAGLDQAPLQAHVERCPFCRSRFEQYLGLIEPLNRLLHRGDCPPPDTLLDFQEGLLPATLRTGVEAHLAICQRCRTESEAMTDFAAEMGQEVAWAERLVQPDSERGSTRPASNPRPAPDFSALFAPLTTLFPTLRPAVGGLKGGGADDALQRLTASTDRVTVSLSLYPAAEGNVRAHAMVMTVEDADSDDDAPFRWAEALWEMWRDRQPVASTLLDDIAEGELPALPPGDYTLYITAPFGERVVLQGIRIEERGTR